MNKHLMIFSLPFIAALSLLGVLVLTSPVYAQDEQPLQPGDTPVEVVFDSNPDETPVEIPPEPDVLPVSQNECAPPSEEPGESPVQVTETQPGVGEGDQTSELELALVLEAVLEEGVTLVDGSGEPLALTTEAAVEALAAGDPWYKVGTITYRFFPTIGGECSGYPVGTCWISDTPIQAAVDQIPSTGLPSDGMIYIEAGNYAETLLIDGLTSPVYKGLKGLIGGMVGEIPLVNLTGSISVNAVDLGFTIKGFNITANTPDPAVSITYSKGALKIEDVSVHNNSTGPGIRVSNHNGTVTMNRVKDDGNGGGGALVENLSGTGGVTITNSSFDHNISNAGNHVGGLAISTYGGINLDGISASNNSGGQPGLRVIIGGPLTIKNSIFNNNDGVGITNDYTINWIPPTANITLQNVYSNSNFGGIKLWTRGNISLSGVQANSSTGSAGAFLNTCADDGISCLWLGTGIVSIKDSAFNNNQPTIAGLHVFARGAITLTNVSASGTTNAGANPDGAQLDTHYSQLVSPVSITNGMFNANDGNGLVVTSKGAITLNKVHAGDINPFPYLERGNGLNGAVLDNTPGTAGVTISGSASGDNSFSHNNGIGLSINSKGAITVKNADAFDNGLGGLNADNQAGKGAVSISKGTFGLYSQENTFDAIAILSKGNVTVSDVRGISVYHHGLNIFLAAESSSSVTVTNSEFTHCGVNGIYIIGRGNITLTKVKANSNDSWGAVLQANTGNITIKGGEFYGNALDGIYASTEGTISLTDVWASGNNGYGADLQNQDATTPKAVTITNGNFLYNNKSGLNVLSKGAITLKNVNATNNNASTVDMGTTDTATYEVVGPYDEDTFTFTGPAAGSVRIAVNTVGFYGEMWLEGCNAVSTHYIQMDPSYDLNHLYTGLSTGLCTLYVKDTNEDTGGAFNVTLYVDNPTYILPTAYGAFLDNHFGTAGITIANPALPVEEPLIYGIGFSMNAAGGLELRTNGAVTLTNIWAGRNAQSGVDIQNHDSAPPYTYATSVIITNLHAWNNYNNGIYVKNKGAITLTNAAAGGGKWGIGAYLNNQAGTGNITIKNNPSTDTSLLPGFDDQTGGEGVNILTHGAVTLTNVNSIGNSGQGLKVVSDGFGAVTLTNCRAKYLPTPGSIKGITIQTNGAVVVNGGYAQGFTNTGLDINNSGGTGKPVTISNFQANGNKTSGISVLSTGAISLSNVGEFYTVAGPGIVLDNSNGTAGITLNKVNVYQNDAGGIDLKTQGAVTYKTGSIFYNYLFGVQVNQTGAFLSKALILSDLAIYNNGGYGFVAEHVNGSITATNIINSDNTLTTGGVVLNNSACANCPVSFLTTGSKANEIIGNNGTGLSIITNGAVTLNKVLSKYNFLGYGVYIENNPGPSSAPKVTINNSDFSFNSSSNGMYIVTSGIITLNNVESSDNGDCTYLDNTPDASGVKGVNVFRSRFNRNGSHGLRISTHGAVVINKIEATGNLDGGMGVWITNNTIPALAKPVSFLSTYGANTFSSNNNINLYIESSGSVVLNNVTADSSVNNSGIYIDNSSGIGIVALTNVTTRYNNLNGIAISTKGNVTLSGVNSLFNSVGTITRAYSGILIGTNDIVTAKVTISNSLVSGNADYGIQLDLNAFGPYTLTNVFYFGNDTDGDGQLNLWVN